MNGAVFHVLSPDPRAGRRSMAATSSSGSTAEGSMAMGPMSDGASRDDRKMAVGPSAPPIIPMEAASLSGNPSARAHRKVMNPSVLAVA